uniref:Sphingomyelin phosphodiesterase C-terminal domain-containing protein n=1 Tax=Strombidium inclinatum TaxID=197538 RepID=A0A7S3MYI0_9SPIT|mmetsp:Transcript_29134/g.43897  ORF Transcript_29134/g.43897 Transcript_29134/m.43897 type:complete len:177 (+) Transcript_29134:1367-1897(+)
MDAATPQKPIGTHWLGASITSFGGGFGSSNPAFTVFDFDAEYMVPVNVHTYAMNLSDANLNDSPNWEEQHDFVSEYNLTDMSPSSLLQFTSDLYSDGEVAAHFKWNTYRRHYEKPDPESMKHDMTYYCFREVEVASWHECMSRGEHESVPVDTPFFSNDFQEWLMEVLVGEWMVDA